MSILKVPESVSTILYLLFQVLSKAEHKLISSGTRQGSEYLRTCSYKVISFSIISPPNILYLSFE